MSRPCVDMARRQPRAYLGAHDYVLSSMVGGHRMYAPASAAVLEPAAVEAPQGQPRAPDSGDDDNGGTDGSEGAAASTRNRLAVKLPSKDHGITLAKFGACRSSCTECHP